MTFERSFLGTRLVYAFNSYKILDQKSDELEGSLNPFASVILTVLLALRKERLGDKGLLSLKLDLTRRLLAKPFSKDKIRVLMTFLKQYVRFEKPETTAIFDQQYEKLTKQRKTMGIEEFVIYQAKKESFNQGVEEGIEQGRREKDRIVVCNLIDGSTFTDEQIAHIVGVEVTVVAQIRAELAR